MIISFLTGTAAGVAIARFGVPAVSAMVAFVKGMFAKAAATAAVAPPVVVVQPNNTDESKSSTPPSSTPPSA